MPNALLKYIYDAPLPASVTLVEGNVLRVKLEAIDKRYTLVAVSDFPNVLEVTGTQHNTRVDSWAFTITAGKAGNAKLAVQVGGGAGGPALTITPALVSVTVKRKTVLPEANTDEGLLVRLFLVEVPAPQEWRASGINGAEEALEIMRMMRRVIVNRLNSGNTKEFMAAGARDIRGIVTASDSGKVQFAGFDTYPNITGAKQKMIEARMAIVNDATNTQWYPKYAAFYEAALTAATEPLPADPSPTGLFGWRTEGRGAPSSEYLPFRSLGRNTFFTHQRYRINGR
ncbi:hypothetical protein [Paracidovorax anthurii]|uniref:Uncharacterized protein n=1 Tax=Paracidovorax anthurii TaxID=78229 RepID=A0A328ZBX2_9BURK|nr:hypothetical protein [Paracidovorax anthurii]RAR80307.1 hypothetical protein AX018_10233 [Paracidovorax anthurii]WCM92430.1 hypothetical protein M5C99_19045 [Acidovorax sp. NCPPB 2350]